MNEVIIEETYERNSCMFELYDNIYRVLDRDGRQIYAGRSHQLACTNNCILDITNHAGQSVCKWEKSNPRECHLNPASELVSPVGKVRRDPMNIPCGCCCCFMCCVEQPNKWTIYDPSGAVAMYMQDGPGMSYVFYARDETTPIGEFVIEQLNGYRGGYAIYRVKFPSEMHTNVKGLLLGAVFLYNEVTNSHHEPNQGGGG